jgi:hypothetical protein
VVRGGVATRVAAPQRRGEELAGVVAERQHGESAWGGDDVAVVPFPQAAHRTRRAPLDATGRQHQIFSPERTGRQAEPRLR